MFLVKVDKNLKIRKEEDLIDKPQFVYVNEFTEKSVIKPGSIIKLKKDRKCFLDQLFK